jgi:L-arabinose 1-dehydrogenase [NAD(P)+]
MRTVVTGAAGKVGTETVEALSGAGHEVVPVTHPKHGIDEGHAVDLSTPDGVADALDGAEAVIHLAADRSAYAGWDSVLANNVVATYNVYRAAEAAGVRRVVFASSNHVQQMANVETVEDPSTVRSQPEPFDPDDGVRPDSLYAVSKVFGEALGSYVADRYGLSVLNFRIGWLLTPDELRARQSDDSTIGQYARATWLSPRDCRQAMRLAVEADLPEGEGALTLNLLSDNHDRYLSITETMCALGYEPADNSARVLGSA